MTYTGAMVFELPPVLVAPMAGGPSTPELVNAVDFGFLAFGTCSVDEARSQMKQTRTEYGVNLFMPQQEEPHPDDVQQMADHLGVEVPTVDLSNSYDAKFVAVMDAIDAGNGPAVVSSMFGCFTEKHITALHDRGVEAWATVTNTHDACRATQRGIDRLIVQGPNAGGHRGTWNIAEIPDQRTLPDLLTAIGAVTTVPLIAAGGARNSADIASLLEHGAQSVACGSAFLLADEAGTTPSNRALLSAGGASVSTRAFSGRYARGLETEFMRAHPNLPPLYPYLNAMLKDRRSEPDLAYCLVGTRPGAIRPGPARVIEAMLLPSQL